MFIPSITVVQLLSSGVVFLFLVSHFPVWLPAHFFSLQGLDAIDPFLLFCSRPSVAVGGEVGTVRPSDEGDVYGCVALCWGPGFACCMSCLFVSPRMLRDSENPVHYPLSCCGGDVRHRSAHTVVVPQDVCATAVVLERLMLAAGPGWVVGRGSVGWYVLMVTYPRVSFVPVRVYVPAWHLVR